MPIFEKDNKRIYFVHIPKTGGTSIYHLFIKSGWKIGNLRKSESLNSTYNKLLEEYGKDIFLDNLDDYGCKFPLQHATYKTWKNWGDFDQTFAVIREPMARFISEIKYSYRIASELKDINFTSHVNEFMNKITFRPWIFYRGFAGHLIPQHLFINKETILFDFESDWISAIADTFGLEKPKTQIKKNVSNDGLKVELSKTKRTVIKYLYRKDYAILKTIKNNYEEKTS